MSFKEFFYFNKSDRKALLFLLIVAVVTTALFYLLSDNAIATIVDSSRDTVYIKEPFGKDGSVQQSVAYYAVEGKQFNLFPFDPNTADSTQLLRLGLQPWQVRNIYKYRAAGGVYRKASDFAKLYGLTLKQYRALEPYIHIAVDFQLAANVVHSEQHTSFAHTDTVRYIHKLKPTEHVLLNSSDTTLLKRVPGIGSYFARQIVNYRRILGGYSSVHQLLEIDDFPEEALHYFSLSSQEIEKINQLPINKLTLNQLKRHPYMGYYRARAIVDYRRLKGPIHSLDDLRMLRDFPIEVIQRLKPYVSYEE